MVPTIETWLPVFPGFYGTHFECDNEELEMDNVNDIRVENNLIGDVVFDDYDWDYAAYNVEVAKTCCKVIERWLEGYVSKVIYREICSPAYYNFTNDSINIGVKVSKKNIKKIAEYIYKHKELCQQYLTENYTSRSGFDSFWSNQFDVWERDTKQFTEFEGDFRLGAMLDFICRCERREDSERPDYTLYEESNWYGGAAINATNYEKLTTMHKCPECGEFFAPGKKCCSEVLTLTD